MLGDQEKTMPKDFISRDEYEHCETVQELNDCIRKFPSILHDYFTGVMDKYAELKDQSRQIRIKYTDDEFGEAAKKLPLPKYAFKGDAGFDLPVVLEEEYRAHGMEVYPDQRVMLHTGMIIEFPQKCWGRIIHRSSTEKKHRLRVIEGVIDDYRGEIICQVHNMNSYPIRIEHGQKIGQLILCDVRSFEIVVANELRPSARAARGFGSTGK
jgi:dUTP pyrophosphatase